jgi:glyoxylase-like metal-dependent hydrolase (beta-lactamase superfamily II)
VKKLIPNKPIRYVVNTHHHFDHSGGLRTYVDAEATIVTSESDKTFYEAAFSAPRTLSPDRLAQSRKKAAIETAGDQKILKDGTRTLELYSIKGSQHDDAILMAFLPKEKILIEADVYTPANPTAGGAAPVLAAVPAVNPNTLNLVDNVERLKLDFETILPLHGPGSVTRAELYAAVRKPLPNISDILKAAPVVAQGGRGGRGAGAAASDPGAQILEAGCTGCHNLARVQSKNLTSAEWQGIVDRMKGRGAEISDEDTSALVDYLAKAYGHK